MDITYDLPFLKLKVALKRRIGDCTLAHFELRGRVVVHVVDAHLVCDGVPADRSVVFVFRVVDAGRF